MGEVRGFVLPDDFPVAETVLTGPPKPGFRGLLWSPPANHEVEGAAVLSVTLPASGGGQVDPGALAALQAAVDALDGRLDVLEAAPPTSVPTGPAGGDLAGTYPNPVLAAQYATTTQLATQVGGRQRRITVRAVSGNTTAAAGELLEVNAASTQVSVAPPLSPEPGDTVTIVKVDASANLVVFNAAVASDASAEIVGRWSGATFVYDGAIWLVHSVNVAYSAAPTAEGGTGTGLTREQADARYEPLGAAQAALSQVSKETVGLGNVANVTPAALPISTATQAALDSKADKTSVRVTTTGGTVTLNASLGSYQAIIATSNVVIAPPSNPVDQQSMRIEVFSQPGADRTVSILSAISNASGQSFPFTVRSARFAVLGLIYSARAERWMIVSYSVEPG